MWLGFTLAGYSVVGNDSIQTLGTFLSSNEKKPWYLLWLMSGSILSITLIYGWYHYGGDVSYGRLTKYPERTMHWIYLLPPIVLLSLTRTGIPVSTSFMILTFFNERNMYSMIEKSTLGYGVAFVFAIVVYYLISNVFEKKSNHSDEQDKNYKYWVILQFLSTGFLWSQWLIQDFANIFVYLPRHLDAYQLVLSLIILLSMLAFIFYQRGGAIQKLVKSKINTSDIKSATMIDAIYGIVLYVFKEVNNIPLSTTWVFVGLLAGREIAVRWRLFGRIKTSHLKNLFTDLGKVFLGLLISIALVYVIKLLT